MNEGSPLDRLAFEVTERARGALMQGLAMHDAATILMATREFVEWTRVVQNGTGRSIDAVDVIKFFMSYAKAMIDSHAIKPESEKPIPGLD